MRTRLASLALVLVATLILAPAASAAGTTFPVGSSLDTPDANQSDGVCLTAGGVCTLRAAIQQANASSGGAPYTINLGPINGQTIDAQTELPAITRDRTFIDGCGVGREVVQDVNLTGLPKEPASPPCVGLRTTNLVQFGLTVSGSDGVYIQGLALTTFARAVRLMGADNSRVRGNWFGLQRNGTTQEANGVAVQVIGRSLSATDPASGNYVGGESDATDSLFADCDRSCNLIIKSTAAGIDLAGGPGDPPAGAPNYPNGTFIQGNWIGVLSATGTAAPNAVAVAIGDAQETVIGGDKPTGVEGNVIAGNTTGVDQGAGTKVVRLLHGVYGISPDGDHTVGNGPWNAFLRGSAGLGAEVDKAVFGPAGVGLDIEGPTALVTGSSFFSPDSARFTVAAIRVGPGGDRAFIGSAAGAAAACTPLGDNCNGIAYTATGAPGIWIDGAADGRIQRNGIGGGPPFTPALEGPPIRIDGGATGATVGDVDDNADERNVLTRAAGLPGVAIGEGATNIVVGDNEGIALDGSGLFTDLVPDAGFGNSGPANGGIQPPVVTLATAQGVGGTATPGATIHVLQLQRVPPQGDPNPVPYPPGYTFPTTPSVATADARGVWGIAFPTTLKTGQKLLASQTTADGSSEYAEPQAATADNPPPIVTFTSGPPTVVDSNVRSATFTFASNKAGSSFQCSLDAGSFVGCTSPYTVNGLETGGHQLQVKATDPIGKQGPPASRNWSILFPVAPPPGPPVSAAAAVRFASLVSLPSARSCISKRSMRITVHTPKGAKVKGVVIRIGGRKVGSAKGARTIPISLKGLKRGTFVVKVEVTLSDKRVIKGSRTYRTCAKKAAKKKKKARR